MTYDEKLRRIADDEALWKMALDEPPTEIHLDGSRRFSLPQARGARLPSLSGSNESLLRLLLASGQVVEVSLTHGALEELILYLDAMKVMLERGEFEKSEPSGDPN